MTAPEPPNRNVVTSLAFRGFPRVATVTHGERPVTILGNCSPRFEEGGVDGGCEDVLDGFEGIDGLSARGFDGGTDVGVLDCAPLGAEAVGDFSISDAGAQRTLGFVVG